MYREGVGDFFENFYLDPSILLHLISFVDKKSDKKSRKIVFAVGVSAPKAIMDVIFAMVEKILLGLYGFLLRKH